MGTRRRARFRLADPRLKLREGGRVRDVRVVHGRVVDLRVVPRNSQNLDDGLITWSTVDQASRFSVTNQLLTTHHLLKGRDILYLSRWKRHAEETLRVGEVWQRPRAVLHRVRPVRLCGGRGWRWVGARGPGRRICIESCWPTFECTNQNPSSSSVMSTPLEWA